MKLAKKTVIFVKQRNKMLEKLEATYSSASFRRLALAEEDRFKSPPVADEGQGEIKKKRGWGRCMNKKSPPPTSEIIHKVQRHHRHQGNWDRKTLMLSRVPKEQLQKHRYKNTHCRHRCRKTLPKSGSPWCPRWFPLPWRWEPVPGSGWTACWWDR